MAGCDDGGAGEVDAGRGADAEPRPVVEVEVEAGLAGAESVAGAGLVAETETEAARGESGVGAVVGDAAGFARADLGAAAEADRAGDIGSGGATGGLGLSPSMVSMTRRVGCRD